MATFTLIHVIISLVGIFTGFIVLGGLLAANPLPKWTAVFLLTTIATSVTGFFFPFKGVTPGIILGVLSLVILAVTLYALYGRRLMGGWRKTYVITAMAAQYFNVFVLVVQLFQNVPAFKVLAPTQSEPPFAITQGLLLVSFVGLIVLALKRFRLAPTF